MSFLDVVPKIPLRHFHDILAGKLRDGSSWVVPPAPHAAKMIKVPFVLILPSVTMSTRLRRIET